jgi:large repetitive protein
MAAGLTNNTIDAGLYQPGSISGTVLKDTDADNDGDLPISGVVIRLLNSLGSPILDGLGQPVTATTDVNGNYSFGGLVPGNYCVSQDQPTNFNSVSDSDGPNDNIIGNVTPIAVSAGGNSGGNNFIEIELGTISGYVFAGATPLSGVTLTLLDENGDPVDGDPNTLGVQHVTTFTSSLGYYSFTGVRPGIYQVGQTQPPGYDSFGDVDGGDINIIGDVSPITLLPGQHSQNNNFIETLDICPDDWAQWKFQHPGEVAGGNPDADAYDNFAEFAFAMPYDSGAGSSWLGHTAWIIRSSTLAPGTLEGVFIRPKGAPLNVTYTLQYAASPANPTLWQSLVITPLMISTVDNGDCTETVTIHDLETRTGLIGGTGTVRIRAELDEVPSSGTDHTSYSEVEGWKETPLAVCCRTFNNPYLRETAFTGTVSGVSGQTLTLAASGGDLTTLLSGASFFLEVTSGDNEGHRFDIASASGNTVTLANDAALDSYAAPFNTRVGAPPANLSGDTVVIRRHWTLNEVFPPTAFGATSSQATADQIQLFAGGAWKILWLYDENDADPATVRWVDAADAGMASQGSAIIPPGQGMFFNNRHSATSILAYGEIRPNDFIRPLAAGSNLVGGGYPLDQSAAGTAGRAMNLAAGFFGSMDFKTADAFYVWNADATIGAGGYNTYFLLNSAPIQPSLIRWVKTGDSTLLASDSAMLLLGNRSVFLRAKNPLPNYTVPNPWNP